MTSYRRSVLHPQARARALHTVRAHALEAGPHWPMESQDFFIAFDVASGSGGVAVLLQRMGEQLSRVKLPFTVPEKREPIIRFALGQHCPVSEDGHVPQFNGTCGLCGSWMETDSD